MNNGDKLLPVKITVGTTSGEGETFYAERYEMQLSGSGDLTIHVNPHEPADAKVYGWSARYWLWYEIEEA